MAARSPLQPEPLLQPEALEKRLGDSNLCVIDATWYLPAAGRDAAAEYAESHLPGAVHLDLASDLADPDAPVRNTLAPPDRLARVFGAAGIGPDTQVAVYDRLGGFSAGRIWWALRLLGHRSVSLLDGGFERWQHEDRPRDRATPRPEPRRFELRLEPGWLADRTRVLEHVRRGDAQIVDARSAERFAGEGDEPARRPGHIPGSLNVPWSANLAGTPKRLRAREELAELYRAAGLREDLPVVTTCGSGVTAALCAFVLTLLGHEPVAVYDGSWAEWGDSDDVPHQKA